MRYAIIENNTVTNIIEADGALPGLEMAPAGDAHIGWRYVEGVFTPPVRPTAQEHAQTFQAEVIIATQTRLDGFAKTRNYDGILSACTYASSAIPKFAAEGQYAVNARDNTWATLYTLMGEVQAGTRNVPAIVDEVMSLLPVLSWPV